MAQWYNSLLFCIFLSFCCCPPVGIILFWTNPEYSRTFKIVFTIIVMLGTGFGITVSRNQFHIGW